MPVKATSVKVQGLSVCVPFPAYMILPEYSWLILCTGRRLRSKDFLCVCSFLCTGFFLCIPDLSCVRDIG